jgi:hypothetical protein
MTGEWSYRCPLSQVDPRCYKVVEAWWTARGMGGMSMGPLPVPGGPLQQSAWFNAACRILDDQYAKDEEDINTLRKKP